MDQNEIIINSIRVIFIEMNKDTVTVTEKSINMYCDKHEQCFNEMDHAYRCLKSFNIMDELISIMKRFKFTCHTIRSFI